MYKTKICQRCNKEFNPTTGTQKYCSTCRVAAYKECNKQYRKDNKEKRNKYDKQWRKDNSEQVKENNKQYCKDHTEQAKEQYSQWYKEHKEEKKEYNKQWTKDNPQYKKQWIKNNPEYIKQWNKINPEKRKAIARKGTAKHRQLGYITLNEYFEGSEGHHIDKERVIYIPEELHKSVYHNIWTGQGMEKINTVAVEWWVTEVRKTTH